LSTKKQRTAKLSLSDEKLIEGCIKGSRDMQQALYDKYSGKMYAVALRYAKAQQEAEDVLQEAFIKVFQSLDSFRMESSLGYWLKRIVVNTALNSQRGKLYMYPMVDVTELKSWKEESVAISDYSHQELIEMVQELPDGCRVIFNLYAIEGYKHHEIAKELNISEGTSKSQYSRAKMLLQQKLAQRNTIRYGGE